VILRHRDETVNAARGMLQEYSKSENEEYIDTEEHIDTEEYTDMEEYIDEEEYMDAEEYMNAEEYMEIEDYASWHYRIEPEKSKINGMMLSEWMLDVPQDFTENWIMVPCPIGKRVRLISGWVLIHLY